MSSGLATWFSRLLLITSTPVSNLPSVSTAQITGFSHNADARSSPYHYTTTTARLLMVITIPAFVWISVSLPASSHSTFPDYNNSTTEPHPLAATCSMILVPLTVSLHIPPPNPPHGQPRSTRYHLLLVSRTSLPVQIHAASKPSQTGDRCFSLHAGTIATSLELPEGTGTRQSDQLGLLSCRPVSPEVTAGVETAPGEAQSADYLCHTFFIHCLSPA
ncbi:uncharacterized protein LOC122878177 isoform X3 [Siniperca chuatsi]|nr:uncharacterized protein LOC122878177 isoform X3 [Siniperca chuatsi]